MQFEIYGVNIDIFISRFNKKSDKSTVGLVMTTGSFEKIDTCVYEKV